MEIEKKVLCLEKRYGNFVFGKVYLATPRAEKMNGEPVDWRIIDEDGDYYPVAETVETLIDNWRWF